MVLSGASAEASVSTLCTGYAGCARAGMSNSGYSSWGSTMYWRMYGGHNCTNYVAYRMVQTGLANTRPWSGGGNAANWGSAMSRITDATPAVGAVAWWKAGVKPAGSVGHVAYVERVVSSTEIIVSQDSWHGDFSWARITRSGTGWPSGFIHFNDVHLLNTSAPLITGDARVGATLAAGPGVWTPTGVTLAYQWLQNGTPIDGATTTTLLLRPGQQSKRISVRVSASSPGFPGATAVSAPTASVQAGVLTATEAPTVTGEAEVGQTLRASTGSWSPAPDELRYQWRVGGAAVAGATDPELSLDAALVGKPVSVSVTAAKNGYPSRTSTSAGTTSVRPGTLTVAGPPTLAGQAQPGHTLSVQLPQLPPDTAVAVQWLRAGVLVPHATSTSYRLSPADLGSQLLAQVNLTRAGYAPQSLRTTSTNVVRAIPAIAVSVRPGTGRLSLTVRVRARGVDVVTGRIQVRSRGRVLQEIPLQDGSAQATVTGLPSGARTYRFRFPTTSTVTAGVVQRRLTIG